MGGGGAVHTGKRMIAEEEGKHSGNYDEWAKQRETSFAGTRDVM